MNKIYLDHAASTPMDIRVFEAMTPYLTEFYGNPSSPHSFGQKMHRALEKSRREIAKYIGARSEEVYFVSGGTESNNWALDGIMSSYGKPGDHLIVSSIEHPAVLNKAKALEEKGYEVTYVTANRKGEITLEAIQEAIKDNTVMISVMMVNNETGVRQNIEAIGSYAKEKGILFHSDGVQALSHLKINLKDLPVDLMSFSAHKINGPVGIGILFVRSGIKIKNLLNGGAQERARRPGTGMVALAVGFEKAIQIKSENIETFYHDLKEKKTFFINKLKEDLPDILINGSVDGGHPGIVNIMFPGVSAENLLMNLDLAGIAVSGGSACASGAMNPSHVLRAMGLEDSEAKASIRFSFGENNSLECLEIASCKLVEIVKRLRGKNGQ